MNAPVRIAIVWMLFGAVSAQAADLAGVDRAIAKEPGYQGKPRYCLVVFGPEAEFRAWLVLDGNVLYVDRNGNGDLTEANERVAPYYNRNGHFGFRPGELGTADGPKYNLSQVRMEEDGCDMCVSLKSRNYAWAGFDGPGRLRFAASPQQAPIVHFFGPLTLHRFEPQPGSVSPHIQAGPLVRGELNHLGFSLGTRGQGSGAFAKFGVAGGAEAEIRFKNGLSITIRLKPDE
ncbi:MAG: hypothetical protein AB7K24_07855 [Gemmataceae bacterium]